MSSREQRDFGLKQAKAAVRTRAATIVGAMLVLAVLVGPAGTGLLRPAQAAHLTFAPGDVFVSGGDDQVFWYHPDGTFNQELDTTAGSSFNTGSAFDSSGKLYVTNFDGDSVSRFNTDGTFDTFFGSGYDTNVESIIFDAAGNAYTGQADGTRDILKFDSTGTPLDSFDVATEFRGSDWIDLAGDQCTMFYTSEGTLVKRYDVCTDTQLADFAVLPNSPAYALRLLPGGGAIVANDENIVRLDASGAVVDSYDVDGQDEWFAVNLDPDGTSFWSADLNTAQVFKFDIESGAVLDTIDPTADGATTVAGLSVFGEFTAATEICGNGIDDDGDGLIDEGCPVGNLTIRKIVILNDEGISVDEFVTLFTQIKIVEATLVEPDRTTIHVYHDIPKDVPAFIAFADSAWEPTVALTDGQWELKLQIIATYLDPVTQELKNIEQKIIIQFDVVERHISTPTDIPVVGFIKDIVLSPHPAQLGGDVTITIGEDIAGETKVFVAEVTLGKPSGELVSYTTLPIDITAAPVTIPYPGPGWVSSDGSVEIDQAGMWELDIELIGFYEDGLLEIKKINQKLWISFNVIPEYPLAILAIATPLTVFFLYRYKHRRQSSPSDLDSYGM